MSKKMGIVGSGISGLLACKHLVEKGFDPVVFEAKGSIGGVWASQTIDSTKLQTPKSYYQFSDFPWPTSVQDDFPHHTNVLDYLTSYALHFNLFPYIKFNSNVVSIDYKTDPKTQTQTEFWEPFLVSPRWNVLVQDTCTNIIKVYEFDFVILCIGKYSDVANVPEFPEFGGPEVFHGEVLHCMDYAGMGSYLANNLTAGKRITVVGFQKSAVDLSAQIAAQNGPEKPCTVLYKKVHWLVPQDLHAKNFNFLNRFSEFIIPKPGQGFLARLLTLLLSFWLYIFSRLIETYLKWKFPLKKYGIVPTHGFVSQISSCTFTILPTDFFRRVEEGSLILKQSSDEIRFCKEGLVVDGGTATQAADVVIFATGYKSEVKLSNVFRAPFFSHLIFDSSTPLYRECIHPRIPQLAILGYSDSPSILYTTEMRSKWVAALLAGIFKLPTAAQMEDETRRWERCMKNYVGKGSYKRWCATVSLQIHCNDGICRDMGVNPKRKKWFLQELFAPYRPSDYANL
ncbi:hypothetical protein V2J09_007029 [Rumex salicifolius]